MVCIPDVTLLDGIDKCGPTRQMADVSKTLKHIVIVTSLTWHRDDSGVGGGSVGNMDEGIG